MIADSSAMPRSRRRPARTDRTAAARACRDGSRDRDARARAAVVEREHPPVTCAHCALSRRRARRRAPRRGGSRPCRQRAPSTGARRRRRRRSRPASPDHDGRARGPCSTASGVRLATSCTALAVAADPSTTALGPSAPSQPVGQLEQRVAERARRRLDGEHLAGSPHSTAPGAERLQVGPPPLPPPPRAGGASRARARARELARRPPGSCSTVRARGARPPTRPRGRDGAAARSAPRARDGLDAAHALSDRPLAHDRERPDHARRARRACRRTAPRE